MKALHLLTMSAAMAAVLIVVAAEAGAQQRSPPFGPRNSLLSNHGGGFIGGKFHGGHFGGGKHHGGKFHGGHFNNLIFVDREVVRVVEVQVQREAPVAVPPPPPAPAPARKPFVVGNSYASLPGGCMKLIEDGVSYYYCGGGEWYRLVGKQYRAIRKP